MAAGVATWILNGWAASPEAWRLCAFERDRLFSYVDILHGEPRRLMRDVRRVILAGWSMGGCHALELASEFPGKIAGLVLVAATPRMPEDRASGWVGLGSRRIDALERAARLSRGAGFFDCPEGKPNPYARDGDENLSDGIAYLRRTDVRERLLRAAARIDCPVHVFHSERDGVVRAANAAFLKSVFPRARVTMIPGGEHALPVFIPGLIDAAVRNCREQEAAAGAARVPAGFRCRRCGNCCRIKDGIVRVGDAEIARMAAYLRLGEPDFIERFTDLAPDRRGLVLKSREDGACICLDASNRCGINPVKPDQCRTFPHEWTNADSALVCPGLAAAP